MEFFRHDGPSQTLPQSVLDPLFTRRILTSAGCSILFYDYILTFSREVQYIWRARWTTVKAMFLLNRYGSLIGQTVVALEDAGILSDGKTSRPFCSAFHIIEACYLVFSLESIRILVLKRAWTIWGCSHRVQIWLISLYILYAMIVIGLAVYAERAVQFQYLDVLPVCMGIESPFLWMIWLAPVAFDGAGFIVVWHSLRKLSGESSQCPLLLRLLMRDAAAFFLATIFSNTFGIICWTVFRNDPRSFMQLSFSVPLLSIVGQRLVLNLRGLKPRRLSTRDLSREVDRQVAALGHLLYPVLDADASPEMELECERGGTGMGVELEEMRKSRSESRGEDGVSIA